LLCAASGALWIEPLTRLNYLFTTFQYSLFTIGEDLPVTQFLDVSHNSIWRLMIEYEMARMGTHPVKATAAAVDGG
jgi:hypothetical protein